MPRVTTPLTKEKGTREGTREAGRGQEKGKTRDLCSAAIPQHKLVLLAAIISIPSSTRPIYWRSDLREVLIKGPAGSGSSRPPTPPGELSRPMTTSAEFNHAAVTPYMDEWD